MAIINSVVIGKTRKSIGNVTMQVYGGRTIGREKPVSVRDPKTGAQIAQRTRMANIVAAWRNQFVALKKYFTTGKPYQSEYNIFCSLNIPYAATPIVNDQGAVVDVPEGLFLSSGSFPQHFLTVTEVSDTINVAVNNAGLRDVVSEGDILAVIQPQDVSNNVSVQEYVLTSSDATLIQEGGTLDTAIQAPEEYVVVWYSPSRRMSTTARA